MSSPPTNAGDNRIKNRRWPSLPSHSTKTSSTSTSIRPRRWQNLPRFSERPTRTNPETTSTPLNHDKKPSPVPETLGTAQSHITMTRSDRPLTTMTHYDRPVTTMTHSDRPLTGMTQSSPLQMKANPNSSPPIKRWSNLPSKTPSPTVKQRSTLPRWSNHHSSTQSMTAHNIEFSSYKKAPSKLNTIVDPTLDNSISCRYSTSHGDETSPYTIMTGTSTCPSIHKEETPSPTVVHTSCRYSTPTGDETSPVPNFDDNFHTSDDTKLILPRKHRRPRSRRNRPKRCKKQPSTSLPTNVTVLSMHKTQLLMKRQIETLMYEFKKFKNMVLQHNSQQQLKHNLPNTSTAISELSSYNFKEDYEQFHNDHKFAYNEDSSVNTQEQYGIDFLNEKYHPIINENLSPPTITSDHMDRESLLYDDSFPSHNNFSIHKDNTSTSSSISDDHSSSSSTNISYDSDFTYASSYSNYIQWT